MDNESAEQLADIIHDDLLDLGYFGFTQLEEIHKIVEKRLKEHFSYLKDIWAE